MAESVSPTPLTLSKAIKATLENNPQLTGYIYRAKALQAQQQTAALKPEYTLSTELENVAGTNDFSGVGSSELTLSLSSVIEFGDQRDARVNLITARQQQLASKQRVQTLVVLTELTHHFIDLAGIQAQLALKEEASHLVAETVATLTRQINTGRIPEAELLRAKAALAQTTIEVLKTRQQFNSKRRQLSAFWSEPAPTFNTIEADLLVLPALPPLSQLINRLHNNPDVMLLADAVRLRAAELQQQHSEQKPSLEWSAGVRRLQETNDSALVFGISIPLASSQRAAGAIASANAKQQGAEHQQQTALIQIKAQLVNAVEDYEQTLQEIHSLQTDVLPLLKQAIQATENMFNQGRYSYLELNLAQHELLDAQLSLIDAAVRAQNTRIDIERITDSALSTINTEVKP